MKCDKELRLASTECYLQEGIGDHPAVKDDLYKDPDQIVQNMEIIRQAPAYTVDRQIDVWLKSTIREYPDPCCGKTRRKISFDETSGQARVLQKKENNNICPENIREFDDNN